MKRVCVVGGKPRFFKAAALEAAEYTFALLLRRYRPPAPLEGPVSLAVTFTWPHLERARKADRAGRLPKATRPDLDNSAKALIDTLVTLRFLHDDGQIARLALEKWHGPDVGIVLDLEPFGVAAPA